MIKHARKRGDTLIEVMLAVGIFSMVAVAVVAVMSSGTSSAQTALETTLAREEIDAQAEALRFIQSSYIAEKGDEDGTFAKLWDKITKNAIAIGEKSEDDQKQIVQFYPDDCSILYDNQNAFIINTRAISSGDSAIISIKDKPELFTAASTYPRLIYYNDDDSSLASKNEDTNLISAEGIYIIAVKDTGTIIVDEEKSAYYDFYIRTCWYGTGDKIPSTISTVMRLYDPNSLKKQ